KLLQRIPTFPSISFTAAVSSYIYTISLHVALPISLSAKPYHTPLNNDLHGRLNHVDWQKRCFPFLVALLFDSSIRQNLLHYPLQDRKSTRLNSSHVSISYAVFCLKN